VLMAGNWANPDELPRSKRDLARVRRGFEPNLPINLPQFALNRLSIKAFNVLYYASRPSGRHIEPARKYFFPLDAIHNWNRLYGRRGFVQYQATVPIAGRQALVKLLEIAGKSGRASFLAVLKRFGHGNQGLLSYPFEGYTLTMDFAVNKSLPEFLRGLDKILLDHGGRLYLAKDATMAKDTFAAMYPNADRFREMCARLDPDGILSSNLARRVGLVEGRP